MLRRPKLLPLCIAAACAVDDAGQAPLDAALPAPDGALLDGGSVVVLDAQAVDAEQVLDGALTQGDASLPATLRFVVLGDGGTGDAAQKKVAAAIQRVCAERGCSFALYLGDNIYNSGVSGPDDAQFITKFEEPYAGLDIPFYVALGNHDYGSEGSNIFPEDAKSSAQVEYTAKSEKWVMPAHFYTVREGPVALFALDTNAIVLDRFRTAQQQKSWLDAELAKSDAPWKIVFGHHPYISNGDHGNAGQYGGAFGLELHNGAALKELVEQSVCGKAQLFVSGHDHHREWLEPTCGTTFIVSGAAAKLRDVPGRGAKSRWADGTKRGFLWVEASESTLTGVFYDEDGTINYQDVITR